MENFSRFGEYGLLGLVVGSVVILLFFVVKWTLATTKDILAQAAKEREDWHKKIGDVNVSIQKVCDCIDKHDEKAEERGRFVRSEHERMIKNLDEQGKILVRMNGYHDKNERT